MAAIEFDVVTNLEPDDLDKLSLHIFQMWVEFAAGSRSLGGRRITFWTGKYQRSLTMNRVSPTEIVLTADEAIAPEARFLEVGTRAFDLKRVAALRGRTLPMKGPSGIKPGTRARPFGPTGFARMPLTITAKNQNKWIIPAMPAYRPAAILAQLARNTAQQMEQI